ncbi:hypothetical protein D3C85_722500 [compost metagenome]
MTVLEEVNASAGPDIIIRTLELNCSAWDAPVFICNGFEDRLLTDELGVDKLYTAANIDIALARKDNKGNQTLAFAVDNTTGEVSHKADEAIEADARVTAVYRTYLKSNPGAPAEVPYQLTLLSGSIQGLVAQLQCGYFNMIGVSWPRELYTTSFVPALRYI